MKGQGPLFCFKFCLKKSYILLVFLGTLVVSGAFGLGNAQKARAARAEAEAVPEAPAVRTEVEAVPAFFDGLEPWAEEVQAEQTPDPLGTPVPERPSRAETVMKALAAAYPDRVGPAEFRNGDWAVS
ncbi:MAG: hypothetical protein LBT93_06660, partial [Treponema sp.]|nr:hypothetical protein [Treponema sp.]